MSHDCLSSGQLVTYQSHHQQAPTDEAVTLQLDMKNMLNMILDDIRNLKASQATKAAALHLWLDKIVLVMTQLPERLKEAEARVSQLEDQLVSTQKLVSHLEKQNESLETKSEVLENRSRCSNLQIVGVPKGWASQQVVQWVDSFIRSQVIPDFSGDLSITRGHCVPPHRLPIAVSTYYFG
ncbi:hypothetical protein NDU88_004697 [Pleurodeles waltl]|uniref:Uncharacterized protein n=1 Tax=Pleurodeles waltl TaxID=8319 RepID=A0AAV7QGL6_PLEWA|nr:hypothetical protein NDU88_004697 [Pleurodeles waltl]